MTGTASQAYTPHTDEPLELQPLRAQLDRLCELHRQTVLLIDMAKSAHSRGLLGPAIDGLFHAEMARLGGILLAAGKAITDARDRLEDHVARRERERIAAERANDPEAVIARMATVMAQIDPNIDSVDADDLVREGFTASQIIEYHAAAAARARLLADVRSIDDGSVVMLEPGAPAPSGNAASGCAEHPGAL